MSGDVSKFVIEAQNKASKYMAKNNISAAKFSNLIKVSQTAFSQFMRNIYTGNIDVICTNINSFLALEFEREAVGNDFEFVETQNSTSVSDAIKYSEVVKRIVLITSKPGAGKTVALLKHAASYRVMFITARATMNTHSFIMTLAENVGVSQRQNTDIILQRVAEALLEKPRTIIIDEAQHLAVRAFDSLRYIWDMTKIPIVISGNEELLQTVRKDARLHQFVSRLQHWRLQNKVTFEEGGSVDFPAVPQDAKRNDAQAV